MTCAGKACELSQRRHLGDPIELNGAVAAGADSHLRPADFGAQQRAYRSADAGARRLECGEPVSFRRGNRQRSRRQTSSRPSAIKMPGPTTLVSSRPVVNTRHAHPRPTSATLNTRRGRSMVLATCCP